MKSAGSLAGAVRQRLAAAGCVAAEEEADELLAAAADEATLETLLRRRERGEPLAWITGWLEFCGHLIKVQPGVYVPRVQSEELARRAGVLLGAVGGGGRAVDLCTGAGAIAVHLMAQSPPAGVVGIDQDRRAASCAMSNAVPTVLADLGAPLGDAAFDVVTAVAPYVPTSELRLLPPDVLRYEPILALDGGADGLDLVRRIITAAARLLIPGGWLLIEVGGEQDRNLAQTLRQSGFDLPELWYDEDGDLRGLATQASGFPGGEVF
jgi:release factor glutamine methyltransferase